MHNWLVVSNIFYFPYIGELIFFRGGETTNQIITPSKWHFRCVIPPQQVREAQEPRKVVEMVLREATAVASFFWVGMVTPKTSVGSKYIIYMLHTHTHTYIYIYTCIYRTYTHIYPNKYNDDDKFTTVTITMVVIVMIRIIPMINPWGAFRNH